MSDAAAYMLRLRHRDVRHRSAIVDAASYMQRCRDVDDGRAEVTFEMFLTRGTMNANETWAANDAAARNRSGAYSRRGGAMPRLGIFGELSFPWELSEEQKRSTAREFAEKHVERFGVSVLIVGHKKAGVTDHFHVLMTTRAVDQTGIGPRVVRDFNAVAVRAAGLEYDGARYPHHAAWARAAWCDILSQTMGVRVDPRTYADQGLDIVPCRRVSRARIEWETRRGTARWRRDREAMLAERGVAAKAITRRLSPAPHDITPPSPVAHAASSLLAASGLLSIGRALSPMLALAVASGLADTGDAIVAGHGSSRAVERDDHGKVLPPAVNVPNADRQSAGAPTPPTIDPVARPPVPFFDPYTAKARRMQAERGAQILETMSRENRIKPGVESSKALHATSVAPPVAVSPSSNARISATDPGPSTPAPRAIDRSPAAAPASQAKGLPEQKLVEPPREPKDRQRQTARTPQTGSADCGPPTKAQSMSDMRLTLERGARSMARKGQGHPAAPPRGSRGAELPPIEEYAGPTIRAGLESIDSRPAHLSDGSQQIAESLDGRGAVSPEKKHDGVDGQRRVSDRDPLAKPDDCKLLQVAPAEEQGRPAVQLGGPSGIIIHPMKEHIEPMTRAVREKSYNPVARLPGDSARAAASGIGDRGMRLSEAAAKGVDGQNRLSEGPSAAKRDDVEPTPAIPARGPGRPAVPPQGSGDIRLPPIEEYVGTMTRATPAKAGSRPVNFSSDSPQAAAASVDGSGTTSIETKRAGAESLQRVSGRPVVPPQISGGIRFAPIKEYVGTVTRVTPEKAGSRPVPSSSDRPRAAASVDGGHTTSIKTKRAEADSLQRVSGRFPITKPHNATPPPSIVSNEGRFEVGGGRERPVQSTVEPAKVEETKPKAQVSDTAAPVAPVWRGFDKRKKKKPMPPRRDGGIGGRE